jgi:myo-inositol-1(or 4)-monophosphatase
MDDFTKQTLSIIRSTRSITLPFYGKAEDVTQKEEGQHNLVTRLDREVELYLKEEFEKLDSSIKFAGEEFGGNREVEKLWLVDPIDGTLHFVRGMPFCTTMVARIENDQVVFSAIYDFIHDVMYHAEKGSGAFKNGEPIRVSERPVSASVISFECDLSKPGNPELRDKLRKKSLPFHTVSAGYEFVLVATGKLEGRICVDAFGKDYDFAPGSLLVSEAGGIVANIGSTTYDYRNTNLIAGNKALFDDLTQGTDAIFPIT